YHRHPHPSPPRRSSDLAVIASGSHGDGPAPAKSEAAIIADLIAATGVSRDRLFLEERSRDTIGNAVEVVARYLRGVEARPIYLRSEEHTSELQSRENLV